MLDVREVGVVGRGEVEHAVAPHVLEQRRVAALEQLRVEDALAQARLGHLQRVEAPELHHGLHRHRAGQDQVAALGLDARAPRRAPRATCPRSDRRGRRARPARAGSPGRRTTACPPPAPPRRRGCAPCRRSPPARPPSASHCRAPELLRQMRPQRLELLALDLVAGQEALGHAHRAERPRAHVQRLALPHVAELQRAAAEVERDAVVERRRVDRREVAVARLLLRREHLDLETRALARRLQEVLLVGRVADRRGGDRAHVVDPGGAAEVGEQLDRLERALHRLRLQLARRVEPGADAHRLVDLVGPAPPAVAAVLAPREHDQAERVRPEVDHRQAPVAHAQPLALDQLDAVAVRVAHEADPRAALAHAVGRLLGLDALPAEAARAWRRGR